MATGGIPMQRGQSSEPRLQGGPRSNRARIAMDVNFRLNHWQPSSMFADGPFDKPKKSKNKEKPKSGQQLGLQSPSTSDNDARRHTPATFPRTRYTTSTRERAVLENLRQQLTFSDMDELPEKDRNEATAINNARQQLSVRLADLAQPEESSNSPGARNDSVKSAGGESNVNNELQPDRNQIVGRLMQIRDYMRQATSMMANLQRVTDGGKDENIDKLKRLQDHLGDQEKGYMDLLQRMLAEDATMNGGRSSNNSGESFGTSVAESMSLNMDAQSDISEATTGNANVGSQMEELASLKQQHDLLKKMLQQQEELRALQGRQQTLLRFQAQIEGKLLKTEQENEEEEEEEDDVSEATTTEATASELEETVISSAELARRRKEALKRIFGEESENVSESEQGAAARITTQESQLLMMASEHEQLQSKLQDLQEKKDQMDHLLVQLKRIRPQPLNNDGDSMSTSSMNVLDVVSQATSATEEATSETSQQVISDDKLRRLEEMRERLNQLRELVQYYQASQDEELAGAGDAVAMPEHEPSSSSVNFEDPRLMSNLRRMLQHGENIISHTASGLNAEEEEDDDDEVSESGTTEASENNETTGETTTEDETESNQSSIMARWGDDPEIREKVRKLQTAKSKLRQLQDLVAMVQHTPEFAVSLPDDLAELAMSINDDGAASDQQSSVAGGSEGLRAFTEQTREAYYEVKMKQQKKELDNLMQERQRLLQVQNQLKDLNDNPTPRPRKTLPVTRTTAVQAGNPLLEASKLMEEGKLATPTRDEIYAEMRRHKILQEELRQKRHELEELLSSSRSARANADDLERAAYSVSENDNDLFRVSMRSADITAAATWGSSTQDGSLQDEMENAEDEDYPSDGIVQVEEEEEEVMSDARSSDTYTIEAQYRDRQRQQLGIGRTLGPKPCWVLPPDSDSDAARHGIRYPASPAYRSNTRPGYRGLTQSARKRQENIRSAEDLMTDDPASAADDLEYLSWKAQSLERQLSNSVNMCHGLIRDQHNMSNLLQTSISGNWAYPSQSPLPPRNPYMNSPPSNPMNDMLANYNMRLQHQQLMLNLNQTYGQLYSLQEDIRTFEEMAQQQQQDGSVADGNYPNSSYPYGPPGPALGSLGSMQSQYMPPQYPGMPYPPHGLNNYSPAYGMNSSYSVPPYTSLAFNPYATSKNVYEPANSAGNQRTRDTRPRFNMNPQEHDEVPPNSELDDDQLGPSVSNREPSFNLNVQSYARPTANGLFAGCTADDDLMATPLATSGKRPVSSEVPPLNIESLLKKMDRQRRPASDTVASTSSKGASKQGGGLMAKAREMSKDHSRKRSAGPRPGLSSSLSGTAFFDAASVTSTVSASSMPGELVNGEFFLPRERRRELKTQSELESDVGSEFSLFEALRETIYSEVATLISQNESRPHYLIELFRELQMLNSDYLRQRSLYALQDLVSKFLTDEAIGAPPLNAATTSHSIPPWQVPTASEHTPSESLITSEDDEMKARLYSERPSRKDGSSVKSGEYDYMEHVDSASSLSTPNSTHDFGFANDDLGDTVIHLDKALRRMREYERMKAEQEAASAVSSNVTAELHKKERPQASTDATSNSSAQDVGSESSFSSLPYPRIDTRQLDHQIKSIMQEVIPCLKEHIDDVCSSELLAYLRRLVLTLTRQRDDSQEFVRFFNKQLGSILQDSLSKFAGRKMRECGEDLLVDISEILFNELAFFRLMQDLDTSCSNLRMNAEEVSETGTGTDTGTGVDEEGEGDSSSEEESSDEDTEAAEEEEEENVKDDVTKAALETAMASASKIEEEDLGKARDDEMAADLGISDKDDDSEEPYCKERVKIELSMSESKAVAYFGSGEDDNDVDSVSLKAEETITSIGACNDTEDEQPHQNDLQAEDKPCEVVATADVAGVANHDVAEEATEAEDDATSEQEPGQSDTPANDAMPNGDIKQELVLEDLPPKLTSLSQVKLEVMISEEQKNNNSSQAVLESMVGMTPELAGDADALPEPSSAPIPNGVVHAGGDIKSE